MEMIFPLDYSLHIQIDCGPLNFLFSGCMGGLPQSIKPAEREPDHAPPSSAKVLMAWSPLNMVHRNTDSIFFYVFKQLYSH